MGRQLLRVIGETDDEGAGRGRVDALRGDRLGPGVDGLRWWGVAAVLELAPGGVSWSELSARQALVEAAEPVVAVEAGEGRVADGLRVLDEALAKRGARLGRGQRLRFQLVAPQPRVERLGLGEQSLDRLASGRADEVVGILTRRKLDEAQGAVGPEVGQGAESRADRRLSPRAVAVEAEDRRRIEPPHPLELGLGDRGTVG